MRQSLVQTSRTAVYPDFEVGAVERRQTISDLALAGDVSFPVAGLFAVTSVVLAFLTDWGRGTQAAIAPAATAWRLAPVLGSASARLGDTVGLQLDGTF